MNTQSVTAHTIAHLKDARLRDATNKGYLLKCLMKYKQRFFWMAICMHRDVAQVHVLRVPFTGMGRIAEVLDAYSKSVPANALMASTSVGSMV